MSGTGEKLLKICVVTSYSAASEPRAPRHAVAVKRAFPDSEVIFVDLIPASVPRVPDPPLLAEAGIVRLSIEFPTKASDFPRLLFRKICVKAARLAFFLTRRVAEGVFGDRVLGLTRVLKDISADVYIAHNIDTLLPAFSAAKVGAKVVFDCMEYYSDMGESQSTIEVRATKVLEQQLLGRCALVIASSGRLSDTLADEYSLVPPFPSYNVPAIVRNLPGKRGGALNLYWRNSVIGFGQRGLQDAFIALSQLPADVHLYIQGRLPLSGRSEIEGRAKALGISNRISILPPYASQEAVEAAALYDIGLCLERKGPRNHDLTVSNKMFDYHMAGLAIVASDLLSLREVIVRSGGGLLYQAGSSDSLVSILRQLRDSPHMLEKMQQSARNFALTEGNLEKELEQLSNALSEALKEV